MHCRWPKCTAPLATPQRNVVGCRVRLLFRRSARGHTLRNSTLIFGGTGEMLQATATSAFFSQTPVRPHLALSSPKALASHRLHPQSCGGERLTCKAPSRMSGSTESPGATPQPPGTDVMKIPRSPCPQVVAANGPACKALGRMSGPTESPWVIPPPAGTDDMKFTGSPCPQVVATSGYHARPQAE